MIRVAWQWVITVGGPVLSLPKQRRPQPGEVFRGAKTAPQQGVYDTFGGVLHNTIPAELTSVYAELPDAASGLVHVGGGRWYDPAIGRPLQPNPAGGAPTAPQTLSRYTATPLGQPGVFQAMQSNQLLQASKNQVPGLLAGPPTTAIAISLWAQTIYKTVPTGYARIALEGRTSNLTWHYLKEFDYLEQASSRLAKGWMRPFSFWSGTPRIRTMIGRAYIGTTADDFARLEARLGQRGITVSLLSREFDEVVDAAATSASRGVAKGLGDTLGVGIGGLLNFGIQYAYDYDNPYLSGQQKFNRSLVSGGFGIVSGYTGLAAAAVFGGPVGIGVAFTLGVLLELKAAPTVFEWIGATPTRDLRQFQTP